MEQNEQPDAHLIGCGCPSCFKEFRAQHQELKGTFRRTIALGVASAALVAGGVVYGGYAAYGAVHDAFERTMCWQQSITIAMVRGNTETDIC